MSSDTLGLRLLERGFIVRSPEERWLRFIERLWEPFVTEPGERDDEIGVTDSDDGWNIRCAWHVELNQPDPWLAANEIRHLLVERALHQSSGVLGVHAAAVATNDRGVILCGDSGAGKTTATMGLVDAGWQYLSDDLAVIDRSSHQLLPFPKPLGIKEVQEWQRCRRHWEDVAWPPPPNDLFLLPPRAFGWRDPRDGVPIAAVVFLGRGSMSIEELSPARAVTELWNYTRPRAAATLNVLAPTCERALCVSLTSDAPGDALRAITRLVE